jgi:hypothetical protein
MSYQWLSSKALWIVRRVRPCDFMPPSHPRQGRNIEAVRAGRSRAQAEAGAKRGLMLSEGGQAGRIRLRLRVDRQAIVVAGHERGDPVLVLGPQHGAGDIDDASALLDEAQRAFQRFVLILDALFERPGAHAPFGVRIAAPGAGAGAGRVDQHQIAASLEVAEHVRLTPRRSHLDIAGA